MSTPAKDHSRSRPAARIRRAGPGRRAGRRSHGVLVQGREARAWAASEPPEVVFAGPRSVTALPAGVWVALRRDDAPGALETMTAVSQTTFLVSSREEMGEGYRLQTVEETRPLPEVTCCWPNSRRCSTSRSTC